MDLSSGGPWLSFEKIVHEINQHCYKNQKYKNNYNSNGFELQNPKEIRQTKTVSGPCCQIKDIRENQFCDHSTTAQKLNIELLSSEKKI